MSQDYKRGLKDALEGHFYPDLASYDYCLGQADAFEAMDNRDGRIVHLLTALQAVINRGRGSKTIERIIKHLDGTYKGSEAGYDGAKEHWGFDGDKLYQYPLAFKICHAIFGCRIHYDPHCQKCNLELLMGGH